MSALATPDRHCTCLCFLLVLNPCWKSGSNQLQSFSCPPECVRPNYSRWMSLNFLLFRLNNMKHMEACFHHWKEKQIALSIYRSRFLVGQTSFHRNPKALMAEVFDGLLLNLVQKVVSPGWTTIGGTGTLARATDTCPDGRVNGRVTVHSVNQLGCGDLKGVTRGAISCLQFP